MRDNLNADVFALRARAAMLDGQEEAAGRELSKLKQIPCPACEGKRQFEVPGKDAGYINYRPCDLCEGTGKALGKLYTNY